MVWQISFGKIHTQNFVGHYGIRIRKWNPPEYQLNTFQCRVVRSTDMWVTTMRLFEHLWGRRLLHQNLFDYCIMFRENV